MAEIQNAGVLKQVVASGVVRRTVNRDRRPHAPAQGEQPLNVIHMVMGEQELLEAARRPVVHQVRNTGIQQGDGIVEFHHRAARATAIVILQARPATRRAVAAKDRHQLGATRSRQRDGQTHSAPLQRFGESEMALRVSFTNVKTVRVGALHAGGKFGQFSAGLSRYLFRPGQQLTAHF